MKLSFLDQFQDATILSVNGEGSFQKRIVEMGFVKGQKVTVVKKAPLQDPIEYRIMGYNVSLRKAEADLIDVQLVDGNSEIENNNNVGGRIIKSKSVSHNTSSSKTIRVALLGNPNAGKTTLFNHASGAREHVGNYSGVTIDSKTAVVKKDGYIIEITDLPGTYSISANSPEELYARRHLLESNSDIILNIIDGSNLERNLYLTTQLLDLGYKMVIALNMYDELQTSGAVLDYQHLSKQLGAPIVPTVSSKGKGVDKLFKTIISLHNSHQTEIGSGIHYGEDIEKSISSIVNELHPTVPLNGYQAVSNRFAAIKLLEKDSEFVQLAKEALSNEKNITIARHIELLEKERNQKGSTLITGVRYGLIEQLLDKSFKKANKDKIGIQWKDKIDNLLTHKLWGFPIFILFMWAMFQATFKFGQYPMDWIEMGVATLGNFVSSNMAEGPLRGLLVDGILGGVGGVIVFLPNILILFLFISLMEDTGYMARAVFIMDKLMHKIGLHGKSFIPLVMGFGCNVPAIMATRTLGSKNDRLLTMLVNPFMSCSARLPVYILIIGAFFPSNPGTMLFAMYFIGITLAILIALLLKKLLFNTTYTPFVMELPPFRVPTVKASLLHMWNKGSQYLKKMGGVILVASIIIWAMGYYPQQADYSMDYDTQIEQLTSVGETDQVRQLELFKENERFEQSYIGRMGQFIEPVISPLGFDWKLGVSLLTGFAAKEIVVSTMGVLYQADAAADENSVSLMDKLKNHRFTRGEKKGQIAYTPLVAFSFMLFVLIYFPCVSTIAAINSESGSKKWAIFAMIYPTVLAWVLSFIVFQLGTLLTA